MKPKENLGKKLHLAAARLCLEKPGLTPNQALVIALLEEAARLLREEK